MKSIRPISTAQYLSGKVRRWHTCTGMHQNNADHSHGVALIITLLHPNPSANLLKAALTHDLGELVTGDLPSPVKKDPAISERIKQMETDARHSMGIPDFPLTDDDKHWLAFADAYEAYLFINVVASPGPSVSRVENDLIATKMIENANALGIMFDIFGEEVQKKRGEKFQ